MTTISIQRSCEPLVQKLVYTEDPILVQWSCGQLIQKDIKRVNTVFEIMKTQGRCEDVAKKINMKHTT